MKKSLKDERHPCVRDVQKLSFGAHDICVSNITRNINAVASSVNATIKLLASTCFCPNAFRNVDNEDDVEADCNGRDDVVDGGNFRWINTSSSSDGRHR